MIVIKRLISPFVRIAFSPQIFSNIAPKFGIAYLGLFEQPKKPNQLSPVFNKQKRLKGHMKQKKRNGYVSPKLNKRVKEQPLRLKNHKGLLKRVKIVGPRWNRQFKRLNSENYHLKRKKSLSNLKRKSRPAYISKADISRVKRLIPYFKRRSLKRLY